MFVLMTESDGQKVSNADQDALLTLRRKRCSPAPKTGLTSAEKLTDNRG
jgi:hypothetical protein